MLAAGGFVSMLTMRLAEPLLTEVARDFEVSVAQAAVLITAFAFAYGVFQLVHGPLGDRLGKLRVTCGALLLASAACVACSSAQSLESLALYRFLTGMTAGAVIPLGLAYVGDNVPRAQRQPVLGRFISGTLLGAALGPLVGGACSQYLGWRASFVVAAVGFAVIGALLLPLARREPRPRDDTPGPLVSLALLARSPSARLVCLVVAVEGWLFYGAFGYLGSYLQHEFALDVVVVGLVLAGFGVGGLIYSASVRQLVERVGAARMVMLGGVLMLCGFCGLAAVGGAVAAATLVLVLGFGFYLMHNTLQALATEMAPAARGAAIAVFAFSLFSGQALGVAADGQFIAQFGYGPTLVATGIGLALLAGFLSRHIARGGLMRDGVVAHKR